MHVAADAMERITRPHFEYVCPSLDPYTQHDINQLESVQKFAPKMISHNWDVGYKELVNLVNLQSWKKKAEFETRPTLQNHCVPGASDEIQQTD